LCWSLTFDLKEFSTWIWILSFCLSTPFHSCSWTFINKILIISFHPFVENYFYHKTKGVFHKHLRCSRLQHKFFWNFSWFVEKWFNFFVKVEIIYACSML
jgi:hypothetical protein